MLDVIGYVEAEKAKLKEEVAKRTEQLGKPPRLVIISDKENFGSNQSYIKSKQRFASEVGIDCEVIYAEAFEDINLDFNEVDGVIMQYPFAHYDFDLFQEIVTGMIPPHLDVDGLGSGSHWYPCTPLGILRYIEHLRETKVIDKDNVTVNVVGYGGLVGKPLVEMLMEQRDYTVCVTRSGTDSWVSDNFEASADVVVCATPKHDLIKFPDLHKVYVDCGCNLVNGKLLGNVSRSAYTEEALITPVPGGVGRLTVLSLYKNVFESYKRHFVKL